MQGGLTLPDATYSSSADRSAVLDEYGIRIHELRMLVRMSAAAAKQHSS
jgi:predicted metalloendopeptidase